MDSGGGFGDGLDGDRGRGVPRPRVGLAGGDGRLWRVDGGALRDRDVDEGLDGVLLCGHLRGGGSRPGEGGAGSCLGFGLGFGFCAGPLLLPSRLLGFLGLRGVVWVVLVMLLLVVVVVVVVVVLLRAVLRFGFRFWFWVRFCRWGLARG